MENEIVERQKTDLAESQPQNTIPQAQQFRSMWNDKELLAQAFQCATYLSKSALVPEAYASRPENCLIAVDLSNRSGLSPLTVMQNLYIVKGKPAWAGQFAIALINGSRRYARPLEFVYFGEKGTMSWGCYCKTIDLTGKEVIGSQVSMQMAQDEGWIDKNGSKWKTMPEQMLAYRAGAFFARVHCPDLLFGIQMVEEVKDVNGYDDNEKPTIKIKCD